MRVSPLSVPMALALGAVPLVGQTTAPANATIRAADLRADLFFLASDAMGGRLTGTGENRLAAEFVKSRFERLGLQAPGGSYYQPFNLTTFSLSGENRLQVLDAARGSTLDLEAGQDFFPLRFTASGSAHGPLAFAGFGIVSPDRNHDDYRDLDVTGSVVIVLDHEPGETDPASPFDGLISSEASRDVRKVLAAQERGAAGVLFVTDVHNHPAPSNFDAQARSYWPSESRRVDRYMLASWVEGVRIPVARISPALAAGLLGGTVTDFAAWSAQAETPGSVSALDPGRPDVALTTSVRRHVFTDRNVVAMLEGADPVLKDQWVILSAHFDHDGADGARIFNGADDDGSGTVALLEIAEAYARAADEGHRPRRSILFAAWNSEERGLLGSWAYTEAPLHPLERTVAVLNMDMIGRNEEVPEGGGRRFRGLEVQTAASNANAVNLMGYSYSSDLHELVRSANAPIGLELKSRYDNNPSQLLRRSDQWPFLYHGVPAMFFHTGLHPDYHTEFDVPEKINYGKMERIARLVHQASWDLAMRDGTPAYQRRPPLIP